MRVCDVLVVASLLCASKVCTAASERLRLSLYSDAVDDAIAAYKDVRTQLSEVWSDNWSLDLPCAEPRARGFVDKAATASQSPTLGKIGAADLQHFVYDGLPVYGGCQVYVSWKWSFIFIRQPKSSSTAVIHAIRRQLCSAGETTTRECAQNELSRVPANLIPDNVWRSFFVFTVVRNPWIRLLSAHTMFTQHFLFRRQGKGLVVKGPRCGNTFADFTENSVSLRMLCPQERCCAWVESAGGFTPQFVDGHIGDQAHCAFLPTGESLVDFIGSSETLDDDWATIVGAINAKSGANFTAAPPNNPNGYGDPAQGGVENVCTDARSREHFNETTLSNIATQYAMDVLRFGYL